MIDKLWCKIEEEYIYWDEINSELINLLRMPIFFPWTAERIAELIGCVSCFMSKTQVLERIRRGKNGFSSDACCKVCMED